MAKDRIAYWMERGETAERAAYLAKGSEALASHARRQALERSGAFRARDYLDCVAAELAAEVAEQIEAKRLHDSAQACLYSSPACTENYLSARCAA